MRRINRRLVLLSIVLVCDVLSVFGRPQEQNTAASQLKDDLINRYTTFTTANPRSLESAESYLSTSKNQYSSNVINRKEDTRCAEPDPSLRTFFQFLLNSTKRKKRNSIKSPDSRLVENFINYSINDLRNPVRADSLDSIILLNTAGVPSSYKDESEIHYLPVPIYTNIPKPKPLEYDLSSASSISGSIDQTSTVDPYRDWQETPLIFPDGIKKPPVTPPPLGSSNYYPPEYDVPVLVNDHSPTFITPVELQAPTFLTPSDYQGPMFVTPISVTQSPLTDGNPPPTIVILEDIDTAIDPPQSDPIIEQDPASAGGAGAGSGVAAAVGAAAAAGAAAAIGAGAGISGIAGGAAVAAAGAGSAGGIGGAGGAGSGVGALTPANEVQCRAGSSASKVCSELITTSSTSTSTGSTFFLDGLISVLTSLNFIGPLALTFWSIIFPPMSIILTSGISVISFLFPWALPRIWFGRQLTTTLKSHHFSERFDNTNNNHQPYHN